MKHRCFYRRAKPDSRSMAAALSLALDARKSQCSSGAQEVPIRMLSAIYSSFGPQISSMLVFVGLFSRFCARYLWQSLIWFLCEVLIDAEGSNLPSLEQPWLAYHIMFSYIFDISQKCLQMDSLHVLFFKGCSHRH